MMAKREITFIVENNPDGGCSARALSEPIFTQADDLSQIQNCVRDAVRCHFDKDREPQIIHFDYRP